MSLELKSPPSGPGRRRGYSNTSLSSWRTDSAIDYQAMASRSRRIFLLSPANVRGIRGARITTEAVESNMAARLRSPGMPLGEVFSFISGLYFRGKVAYAERFAEVGGEVDPAYVITASAGLVSCEENVTLERLREICAGDLDPANKLYRGPLDRDANALRAWVGRDCQVILLGSIATPKYVQPLLESFGEQLFFPAEFIGRGDMSRGGLMLRCVSSGVQLTYLPVKGAVRHGVRPPKLARQVSEAGR